MTNCPREKLNLFNPETPLDRAATIPSNWYADKDILDLECAVVFGCTWQAVGRANQVTAPGSFFTADVAGEPIVVVRDEQGVLRGFSNVCRHRAALVMPEPEGKTTRLRCRYHGWTYDLAGRLRGTPEFDGVANFCREDNGLPPVAVAVWGPVVWANLGKAPEPCQQYLSPLPQRTGEMHIEALRFVERREYRLECNWKVFVDNYLDGGYHINTVHPGLAGLLDYSQYRTDIEGNTSVQIGPLQPKQGDGVAKVRGGANAYYWWVYPNFMMNLYQGVMDTNLVLPLGPGACRVVFDFYFAQTEGTEARQFIDESIKVAHEIQLEDIGICEEVQRGLKSRSYSTGRFSVKREAPGYHFHQLLSRQLQRGVQ